MMRLRFHRLLPLALLSVNASVPVPHLDGVFLSIGSSARDWTADQWRADIQSMADIGLRFFVVQEPARGIGNATARCPSGTFETLFPPGDMEQADCFTQVGANANASGGTLGVVLRAAQAAGVRVHLGLALQTKLTWSHTYPWFGPNTTRVRHFAATQWAVARRLWALYGAMPARAGAGSATAPLVAGFYTEVEESNYGTGWLSNLREFAENYLAPLSSNVKHALAPPPPAAWPLAVWASPYFVANATRYPDPAQFELPRMYAEMWEEVFVWAPDFDLVALQDSVGANGNSLLNVADYLGNLSAAAARQRRAQWANVELFEVWPRSCQWSREAGPCRGRHPAPWERIKAQLAAEAALVHGAWPNATSALYSQYKDYVHSSGWLLKRTLLLY
eukprot:g2277.t1